MNISVKRARILIFVNLLLKVWLCVLFIPEILALKKISLAITHFNPSEVGLRCSLDYDGNTNDVFFDVFKQEYSCLHRTFDWCRATQINNCGIECQASYDPRILPFLVKLDGSCEEIVYIRCRISNANVKPMLILEEAIQLTSQSDPPVIVVNGGQPVEVSCYPVEIVCTVSNMCYKSKVDIYGTIPMIQNILMFNRTGQRYIATAQSQAIFNEPGNYTVVCKETGKDEFYSSSLTVHVHPVRKVICPKYLNKTCGVDEHFKSLSNGLRMSLSIFISSTVVMAMLLCFLRFRKMRKIRKRKYKLLESQKTKTERFISSIPIMATAEEKRQWRDEILDGVEKVPIFGVPGQQIVCGANSEPILVGLSPRDVLISATEFGQGRIVVFCHDEYTKMWFSNKPVSDDEQKISRNILSWITDGKYDENWRVVLLSNENLCTAKVDDTVFIWQGAHPEDFEMIDNITKFVWDGGSVIVGVTPWGSMQLNSCDVADLSCYKFLKQFEIFLTDRYFHNHDEEDEVIVAKSRVDMAHFGDLLRNCKTGETEIFNLEYKDIEEIGNIPEEDCEALLKGHLCSTDVKHLCKIPLPTKPVEEVEDRRAVLSVNLILKKSKLKAPGVNEFPGDFLFPRPLFNKKYKIKSNCSEAHPVGAYLAPGGTAIICVEDGNPAGWIVQVGCHSDNLSECDKFKRWPDIVVQKKLERETSIHSPFGGSIYFFSPKGKSNVSVHLNGIVEAPLFIVGDKRNDWTKNRMRHGLWADFVGRHIMITVPSKTIRELDNPAEIMEYWDDVVMAHHDLKGLSQYKQPKEWLVPDVQRRTGKMRSSYPIVFHMDTADPKQRKFLLRKPTEFVDDYWEYFHELGLNMQDSLWTFEGAEAVTCDIFSLHAMEKLFGIKAWDNPRIVNHKGAMKRYKQGGMHKDFKEWKDNPGIALGIYAQLAREFGFETYKEVFRHYNEEKPNLTTNQEKIDHWVLTFSKAANTNLILAFYEWGFPVSRCINNELVELEVDSLEDEVSRSLPE